MKSEIQLTFHGYFKGTSQNWSETCEVTFFPLEKRILLDGGLEFTDPEQMWWYPQGTHCEKLNRPWLEMAWGEFIRKICEHTDRSNYRYAALKTESETEWIFTMSIWGYDSDGEVEITVKKDDWSFSVKELAKVSNFTI